MTVSAHQRASKTYREERSRRKPCNPHKAKEKHQGSRQEQTIKDAMMVVRLRQKSVPKETVHNTKPVATKYHEQRKEKLDKTRKPRLRYKESDYEIGLSFARCPVRTGACELKRKPCTA